MCKPTFIALVLVFLGSGQGVSQTQSQESPPSHELQAGWQFRWGDSPFDKSDVPQWTIDDTASGEWQALDYERGVQEPPIWPNEQKLWLRVRLPDKQWNDPHVFIGNTHHGLEIYLQGRRIFGSGNLNGAPRTNLVVPSWRMVPLGSDYHGSNLFIRIHNADQSPLYLGRIFVGSKSSFITRVMKEDFHLLILGILFVTVGFVPLLIFIRKRQEKVYFAFALFSISFGFWSIADAIKLVAILSDFRSPAFNILFVFPCFTPVGLCLYFEHIFGVGYKSIILRLRQIHLVYAMMYLIIVFLDLLPISSVVSLNVGFFLIFGITLLVLLTTSVLAAIRGRTDARIISAGFVIFALLGFYDIIGGGLGLISSWSQVVYPWGLLVFILSLGLVLERRFSETHEQLQEYSKRLETKVVERTEDLKNRTTLLEKTLEELRSAQTRLVQSEKMAALGSLTAGIAHEMNSPIGVLKSTLDVLIRCVKKIRSTPLPDSIPVELLEENSRVALTASDRIIGIVEGLKNFARLDEAEFQKVDIHTGIESTLSLIQHLIRDGVKVVKEYGDVPQIYCYASEVNQVFMTILTNAIQAIETAGQISIETITDDQHVRIKIADTGRGIPTEELKTLFDVGFVKKESKIRMAMGLSSAYDIVQRHNGEIHVESELGIGTKFTVLLPVNLHEMLQSGQA